MKHLKYIAPLLLFLLHFTGLDKETCGFNSISGWQTCFTYQFLHTSIIHVLLNSFCFAMLLRNCKFKFTDYVWAFNISALCAYISTTSGAYTETVTVGFSGVLYAIIGMQLLEVLDKWAWNAKQFLSLLIVSLLISFFNPHSNTLLHILCAALGYLYWLVETTITKNDQRRNTSDSLRKQNPF